MRTALAILCGLVLVALSVAAQQRSKPSIDGVWKVVEQTINDRTLKGDQLGVGYHIYTEKHFAVVRESDVPPRPDVIDVDNATAAQLRAVWGPFVAKMGTYELSGDRLSFTTLVAKNPSNMSGRTASQRFTLDGDALTLEPVERVPGNRAIVLKMVRVE
jgi:hypothetical protein